MSNFQEVNDQYSLQSIVDKFEKRLETAAESEEAYIRNEIKKLLIIRRGLLNKIGDLFVRTLVGFDRARINMPIGEGEIKWKLIHGDQKFECTISSKSDAHEIATGYLYKFECFQIIDGGAQELVFHSKITGNIFLDCMEGALSLFAGSTNLGVHLSTTLAAIERHIEAIKRKSDHPEFAERFNSGNLGTQIGYVIDNPRHQDGWAVRRPRPQMIPIETTDIPDEELKILKEVAKDGNDPSLLLIEESLEFSDFVDERGLDQLQYIEAEDGSKLIGAFVISYFSRHFLDELDKTSLAQDNQYAYNGDAETALREQPPRRNLRGTKLDDKGALGDKFTVSLDRQSAAAALAQILKEEELTPNGYANKHGLRQQDVRRVLIGEATLDKVSEVLLVEDSPFTISLTRG